MDDVGQPAVARKGVSFRGACLTLLMALVLIWPPIHMLASRSMGFSPWKLAGWGMYSKPHPNLVKGVTVLLCETECRTLPDLAGEHSMLRIQVASPGGPKDIAWELPKSPDTRAVWGARINFLTFMTNANLLTLQSRVNTVAERLTGRRYAEAIVMVQEFRINLVARTVYRGAVTYRLRGGEIRRIGATDRITLEELNALTRSI